MVNPSGSAPRADRHSSRRPLRVFAYDPMVDRFREPIVLRLLYEPLAPGPAGRLVEVIDLDVAKGTVVAPVDLDGSDVLLNQGLTPSERDPQFHQQMIYAVTMKVLETAEHGLGRPLVWRSGKRLKLIPHAMDNENAWFEPKAFALVFGQFAAHPTVAGNNLPGQTIYTCLSYDVVAHQATHPVLAELQMDAGPIGDGAAIIESVADLMGILVRCGERVVVERAIRESGVDLRATDTSRVVLFSLGQQFGAAMDTGRPIRDFPDTPDLERYARETEAHDRSTRLTSAIIEGLLETYREQTADLVGLAGVGARESRLHPDLVHRLASELSSLATDTLHTVIAALDFLPPCAPRFGDFLRAFLTADQLLFGPKHARLRPRMIEAFHRRGLAPNAGSLAEEALVWPDADLPKAVKMPRASEVVAATQRAFEWRRRYMSEHPHLARAEKDLRTDEAARVSTWIPEIADFAAANAKRLGFEESLPPQVTNLAGAFHVEADGALRARAVAQLVQYGGSHPRGVTIHSDANGDIDLVVRTSTVDRAPPGRWRGSPAPQYQALAKSLKQGW